jgi:hypothetical protein
MIRANRTLIEITVCSELIELMKAQGKPAVPLLSRSEQTNAFMVDLELEGDFVDPLPSVSIRHRSSGRPAAGNDDGFAERSPIFLLPDRIHRP